MIRTVPWGQNKAKCCNSKSEEAKGRRYCSCLPGRRRRRAAPQPPPPPPPIP